MTWTGDEEVAAPEDTLIAGKMSERSRGVTRCSHRIWAQEKENH